MFDIKSEFTFVIVHHLEPYYNWRDHYIASDDPKSPFYERVYSEFEFTNRLYDHYIHPQWDEIGSPSLFIKILFADYEDGFAIIEMIGEWNDAVHNDIMTLKRDIIDDLMHNGIHQFILIGENILNFHHSDDSYYEEWFDDVLEQDGWIALLGFREHVLEEFQAEDIDNYFVLGGQINILDWRTLKPEQLHLQVSSYVQKRLGTFI